MSLHDCMLPHGPDKGAFDHGSTEPMVPQRQTQTMRFMFETRFPQHLTEWAAKAGHLQEDYIDCWGSLERKFDGTPGVKQALAERPGALPPDPRSIFAKMKRRSCRC
jgi:homogentisate 1,2-dioxygenase